MEGGIESINNQYLKIGNTMSVGSLGENVSIIFNLGTSINQICVHKWHINDREISLFRRDNELRYEMLNHSNGQITKDKIDVPEFFSIEDMISYLKACEVVLESNDELGFSKPYSKWSLDNAEICLLRVRDELVWQIFDRIQKEWMWSSFSKSTVTQVDKIHKGSNQRPPELKPLIKSVKDRSIKDQLEALKEFTVYRLIINPKKSLCEELEKQGKYAFPEQDIQKYHREVKYHGHWSNIPFNVYIELFKRHSVIDNSITVNKFCWSVTLVTYKGPCGNHANIITEGMSSGDVSGTNEGEYFIFRSHLKSENNIESIPIAEDHEILKKYQERTYQWKVSSEKAKGLLAKIKTNADSGQKFFLFGINSFLSFGGHNCCTWARELFKSIDIELEKTNFEFFVTTTKSYTNPREFYQNRPTLQTLLGGSSNVQNLETFIAWD
jgi:hypothetical protein